MLDYEIQKKVALHDYLDDACATMKVVLTIIKHGVDNTMTIVQEDVLETNKAKMLL